MSGFIQLLTATKALYATCLSTSTCSLPLLFLPTKVPMPVPPTVTRWFASQYPSLQLAPQWLEECHTYLSENFALSAPALLKKVENQLLLSDLATSTLHHAGLFPPNEEQTGILFDNVKGAGVLVQVLEILEIGRPAHELLKLHRDKVEDRKVFREQGRAVMRAVNDVDPTQDDNPMETQDAAAAEASNNKLFPRSMLRLRLSDGFNEYVAIETKRIGALSMDDTQLGCKLMLKNVRCLRGILMLDGTCCIVKTGAIPDLEADRDAIIEALLLSRIENTDVAVNRPVQRMPRMPPSPPARRPTTAAAPPRAQAAPVARPPAPRAPPVQTVRATHQNTASRVQLKQSQPEGDEYELLDDDDDDDFDEEALAVLQAAEAADSSKKLREAASTTSRTTNTQSLVRPSTAGPSRGVGGSAAASATSSTVARPSHMPVRAAQVIDLDDSDEDEDETVALMLLSSDGPLEASGAKPNAQRSIVPMKGSRTRRNEPIEID